MQQLDSTASFPAKRWAFVFILLHLCVWTLAPILVRFNLPLDAIEGSLWGHQLEWGYDKNPFLNGWLTALAVHLDGHAGWMIYFFSQLSVALCFLAVWGLAKEIVPPVFALIAVMILEGVQYYTFHAIDFNDNTLELSLWALTSYFFYQALRKRSTLAWICTGVFAALGMMAKYYTAALLAAMAIFLFLFKENRQQLKTLAPYIGLFLFISIMLPHIVWLFYHDFITVNYVFQRASSAPSWTNHFFFPAQFAWQQAQAFLPALLLFLVLFIGKKPQSLPPSFTVKTFDRQFLFVVGMGPFLLTVLLSLLLGIKLRAGWGMPLLSLWGILLVSYCKPALTRIKLHRFIAVIFSVMALLIIGYCYALIYPNSPSSANFPGREIAQSITQIWQEKFHRQLNYVAGSRWIGGNIQYYSADHPAVFVEWDLRKAPWINLQDLQKQGAMFVWDISEGETLPATVKAQFPLLQEQVLTFPWHRNSQLAPVKIGIAILTPQPF